VAALGTSWQAPLPGPAHAPALVFLPPTPSLLNIGVPVLPLQAGCVPILHMRGFQKGGKLPDALVADIKGRPPAAA
jgi:hypothetical protein